MSHEILDKWIKEVEKTREGIKTLTAEDRLKACSSIAKLHGAILGSLKGWSDWLKNPTVLDQLSEEELKETFEIFRHLALEFLDLDLKMTRAVLKKQPKKKKSKNTYVS